MSDARQQAVSADYVFDGGAVYREHAVVFEGARIAAVLPRRDLSQSMPVERLPEGLWLAPGFIDVQVNGGGDVLFNDDPSPEAIRAIAAAHRRFGTTSLLPTLISDTPEKMGAAWAAVEAAIRENPGILGIHFEGPWLSPEKPGVHDSNMFRAPRRQDIELLTGPRPGAVLVTLAPERLPPGFVAELARAGVRVSLGHSMATYEETKAAMTEGLTGFTHLFNAMRPLGSREPGPIGAALEALGAWYGMIVDGEHVAPPVLRLALRGAARPMLVTDAMPPVGGSAESFHLQGRKILVHNGRCTTEDGTLAGAALDMASAVRNAVRLLNLTLSGALRAASTEPARFLGLADRLGRLAPNCRADMVAIDPNDVSVHGVWVAGRKSEPQRP